MKRALVGVGTVILALTGRVSGDNKQDQAKMQGTWQDTSNKDSTVVIKGDTMKLMLGQAVLHDLTFKLDTSKSPKQIDLTIAQGMGKGQRMLGIYKFDGDQLVIAYPLPQFTGGKLVFGQARPRTFPTMKGGTSFALLTLKK
jgi:uncharacterized protein (TIGR03067 family)